MSNASANSFHLRNDRGAILVLASVTVGLVILFCAICFNIASLRTAYSEQKNQVFKTASGALSAYTSADIGDSMGTDAITKRMNAAIGAAEVYTSSAEESSFIKAFLPNTAEAVSFGSPFGKGNNGELIPGIWYFRDPGQEECSKSINNCPCAGTAPNQFFVGQCFRPLTQAELSVEKAPSPNALRAVVKVSETSPFQLFLGNIVGRDTMTFSSMGTAAFPEVNVQFLVDVSRSSQQLTHLPLEQGPNPGNIVNGAEMAYRLRDGIPCVSTCTTNNAASGCRYEGGSVVRYSYDGMFRYQVIAKRPTRDLSNPVQPTVHYANDYRCQTICFDGEVGSCNGTEYDYLIDTFSKSDEDYFGAEPISSFVYGLNFGLTRLKALNVPGDRVGMVAFDNDVSLKNRIVEMSELSDDKITKLIEATDLTKDPKDRLQKFNLFPRMDSMSFLGGALDKAFEQLHNAPNQARSVESHMVVFTDGNTNCTETGCSSSSAGFANSFAQALSYARTYLVPNNVHVHFVIAGAITQPHTLAISKDGKCQDDEEFRDSTSATDLFVDPTLNSGTKSVSLEDAVQKGTGYYYAPNELYRIARETGGTWCPIRPACPAGAKEEFESRCSSGNPKNLNVGSQVVVDDAGRLLCDLDGRTMHEQVAACLTAILAREPSIQVE